MRRRSATYYAKRTISQKVINKWIFNINSLLTFRRIWDCARYFSICCDFKYRNLWCTTSNIRL